MWAKKKNVARSSRRYEKTLMKVNQNGFAYVAFAKSFSQRHFQNHFYAGIFKIMFAMGICMIIFTEALTKCFHIGVCKDGFTLVFEK